MQAVGSYLQTLRECRVMGVGEVVSAIASIAPGLDTNATYIWRVERGKIESPGARLLFAFTAAVGGSFEHIGELLLSSEATPQDGSRLAEHWYRRPNQGESAPEHSTHDLIQQVVQMAHLNKLSTNDIIDIITDLALVLHDQRAGRAATRTPSSENRHSQA
jgi:transcriptional regulator with XRE-family HTH domain